MRLVKIISLIAGIFLFIFSDSVLVADDLELGGYFKNFFVVFHQPEAFQLSGRSEYPALVNNRVRLKMSYDFSDLVGFKTAYAFTPRVQEPYLYDENLLFTNLDPTRYRAGDFKKRLYRSQNNGILGVFHNLDRAVFKVTPSFGDIYLGRQAIAWGTARVINPTDIIAPYSFEELDTEERIGVDALRMRIPIGFMGELDLGYVAGNDFAFKNSAYFLRTKLYYMQTDISLMAVGFRENMMFGLNLARSIEGAGAWMEAAYNLVDPFEELASTTDNYLRITAGADYNFNEKTYGFIEAHYNEAGLTEPTNYFFNFMQNNAYSEGSVYLMGTKYIIPGISYQISPLLSLDVQGLYNVDDGSSFIAPVLEYSFAQDVYIGGGAYIGFGEKPELGGLGSTPFPVFKSEFGGYPDFLYSTFRIYF